MIRVISMAAAALCAALAVSVGAFAAPKEGCPAAQSENDELSIPAASDRIWPGILDKGAFDNQQDNLTAFIAAQDKNADGYVCLRIGWGEELNPNAHWYKVGVALIGSPTEQYFVRDNNANGDNR